MDIYLICVGKIKEKYLTEAINEYLKRLNAFCTFNIIEVKESNFQDISKNIEIEGNNIISNIKDQDYVITLEIEGNELTSVELSSMIKKHYTYSNKRLVFVIGGSDGLSDKVKNRSNYKLSFSRMTFPHQLMRVIFLEQIYRAFMIINNHKYHK